MIHKSYLTEELCEGARLATIIHPSLGRIHCRALSGVLHKEGKTRLNRQHSCGRTGQTCREAGKIKPANKLVSRFKFLLMTVSEVRCLVVLCSVTLVDMDEHILKEVDRCEDSLTLIELTYMLDGVVVEMVLNSPDLIVEHESVDDHGTDLTEEDR